MEDKKCSEYETCKRWNSANCDECEWKKMRDENTEKRKHRFDGVDLSADGY